MAREAAGIAHCWGTSSLVARRLHAPGETCETPVAARLARLDATRRFAEQLCQANVLAAAMQLARAAQHAAPRHKPLLGFLEPLTWPAVKGHAVHTVYSVVSQSDPKPVTCCYRRRSPSTPPLAAAAAAAPPSFFPSSSTSRLQMQQTCMTACQTCSGGEYQIMAGWECRGTNSGSRASCHLRAFRTLLRPALAHCSQPLLALLMESHCATQSGW